MLKGVSKQVIVVEGNSRDFFENAIFILNEHCVMDGVGDRDLLQQARKALLDMKPGKRRKDRLKSALWAAGGFVFSCGLWSLMLLL